MARKSRAVNDVHGDPILDPVAVRDVKSLRLMIRKRSGQPFEPVFPGEVPGKDYAALNAWDEGIRYYLPIHEGVML